MASGYVETYIQGSSGICASSSTVNCITDKTYPSPRNSKSVFPIDDSQLRVLSCYTMMDITKNGSGGGGTEGSTLSWPSI